MSHYLDPYRDIETETWCRTFNGRSEWLSGGHGAWMNILATSTWPLGVRYLLVLTVDGLSYWSDYVCVTGLPINLRLKTGVLNTRMDEI